MRQLRDDTHLILDGEVRVYRRERSKRWQAAFVIDGRRLIKRKKLFLAVIQASAAKRLYNSTGYQIHQCRKAGSKPLPHLCHRASW
jgi:hypothetical protein